MNPVIISGTIPVIARKLSALRRSDIRNCNITLCIARTILTPAVITMLASWVLEMKQRGISFSLMAQNNTQKYLGAIGLDQIIAGGKRKSSLLGPALLLPLRMVYDFGDQMLAIDELCEFVLKQFSNARELLPAFEWAVNEITDNVFIHAQSPTPCVISAQYFPVNRQFEIALVDQGIGLLGTLGPSHGAQNEKEAIDMALKRGLTRDTKIGQGNGLAGTERIAELNNGEVMIWTGQAAMIKTEERHYSRFAPCNGVGIVLRLNVDVPVDLGTTWIGQRPYTYIDRCSEEIDNGSAIIVSKECGSVGSRDPARRLRNKIIAILPDTHHPITLDFSGCRDPSSSFLDELFGRLIGEIGINAYQSKIRIEGLKNTMLDRANVVIHQRLELIKIEQDIFDYAPSYWETEDT